MVARKPQRAASTPSLNQVNVQSSGVPMGVQEHMQRPQSGGEGCFKPAHVQLEWWGQRSPFT